MSKGGSVILRIYFALVSFVTLMILVFAVGDLLNLSLKTWVFPAADAPGWTSVCDLSYQEQTDCDRLAENERRNAMVQKQQSAVRDISMLLVSTPVFWLHFRIVHRDWLAERERKDDKKKA